MVAGDKSSEVTRLTTREVCSLYFTNSLYLQTHLISTHKEYAKLGARMTAKYPCLKRKVSDIIDTCVPIWLRREEPPLAIRMVARLLKNLRKWPISEMDRHCRTILLKLYWKSRRVICCLRIIVRRCYCQRSRWKDVRWVVVVTVRGSCLLPRAPRHQQMLAAFRRNELDERWL